MEPLVFTYPKSSPLTFFQRDFERVVRNVHKLGEGNPLRLRVLTSTLIYLANGIIVRELGEIISTSGDLIARIGFNRAGRDLHQLLETDYRIYTGVNGSEILVPFITRRMPVNIGGFVSPSVLISNSINEIGLTSAEVIGFNPFDNGRYRSKVKPNYTN
jgi:hypothetical protein